MKTSLSILAGLTLGSVVLALPQTAQAAVFSLTSTLNGSQEVPPVASPATGSAALTYDDIPNLLSYNIQFSGLLGTTTVSHFHGPAPRGMNAPVLVDINTTAGFTSPLIGTATLSETQESQLLAGLWYINIHTNLFPGGEIRGQVDVVNVDVVVPEPSSLGLVGVAGLSLLGLGRRQRNR